MTACGRCGRDDEILDGVVGIGRPEHKEEIVYRTENRKIGAETKVL